MSRWALGIDTSNYRTSCALFDPESRQYRNIGELLPVPQGTLGLRQSDALFQHVRKLPELMERLCSGDCGNIGAVGVSDRPRRQEGSYMPCFLAGLSAARSTAAALGVPICFFSHQEGHIASALFSAGCLHWAEAPFLSWHLSGGTTELLLSEPAGHGRFNVRIIGGTKDISAGQLIDRTGVALGLPFPAGPHLEKLAETSDNTAYSRVRADGLYFSLSGVENQFHAAISQGQAPPDTARFTLNTVAQTVLRITQAARKQYGLPVLLSGGVSASVFVRRLLPESPDIRFASLELGGDNAVGPALLAALQGGML